MNFHKRIKRKTTLNDLHLENNLEDLDDPVGGKEKDKTGNGPGETLLTAFLGLRIGGVGQECKATRDEHEEEDEAGDDEGVIETLT